MPIGDSLLVICLVTVCICAIIGVGCKIAPYLERLELPKRKGTK